MEPKTETKVVYDDRRKEMTQHFKSSTEIKIGEEAVGSSVIERTSVFKEDGIRKILKDLGNQRTKHEQAIKGLKENLKDVELTSELKELEEKIQKINEFNKVQKTKSQLEVEESDLKIVKEDIQEIKDAIGTRLKL